MHLGPFELAFLPDGDDPGTGIVELATEEYTVHTQTGVPLTEWRRFVTVVSRR